MNVKISSCFIFVLLVLPVSVFALDTGKIFAYPVPYSPKKGVLTVKAANPITVDRVKFQVYDINGDLVFSRTYQAMGQAGIKWSGRNRKGDHVKPGMYIIKLVIENSETGEYKKKIIRVLVRY